jgi:glutamate-1-semialdehyde 2,1-aminomutase
MSLPHTIPGGYGFMARAPVSTSIVQDYAERFAGSLAMHERGRQVIPGGITHDGRFMKPFPPYIARAQGAYKWDVDGHRLIDYVMGHGSLLFGHNDPDILAAMQAQLPVGTHYGAGHEGEIRWAEEVSRLVPSAETVKFTGSGTEATLLAIRVARSFTGRSTVVKLEGHFHGWHDYLLKGERPPFEGGAQPGIPSEVLGTIAVVASNDLGMLEERLAQPDVAALILEPSGGSWATIPLIEGYLQAARELATKYGVVLIFDEVITGFRYSPGGYQAWSGVTPDMSVLGKIVTGGLPGGAVVGRADIMGLFDYTGDAQHDRYERVSHLGTFNANPLSTASGVATLSAIADGAAHAHADRVAAQLRRGMDEILERHGAAAYAYGESSIFHVYLEAYPGSGAKSREALKTNDAATLKGIPSRVITAFQRNLQIRGVDLLSYNGGLTSAVHSDEDVRATLRAFDEAIQVMLDEKVLARVG